MRKREGFTLAELMLAVTLMVIVLGAVYGAVWSGRITQRKCDEMLQSQSTVQSICGLLEADIATLAQPDGDKAVLQGKLLARTDGGVLLSLLARRQTRLDSEAMSVDYFFMPAKADTKQPGMLVRRTEPLVKSSQPSKLFVQPRLAESNGCYEIIARDVRSATFRFFDGLDWQTTWNDPKTLPKLVEFSCEIDDKRGTKVLRTFDLPIEASFLLGIRSGAKE